MEQQELIQSLSNDLAIDLPPKTTHEELIEKLSAYINQLINHNFQQLIYVLYRVDINEAKLKHLLKDNPGDNAGNIIAQLIIDRQLQKIQTRKKFKSKEDIPDDDKW